MTKPLRPFEERGLLSDCSRVVAGSIRRVKADLAAVGGSASERARERRLVALRVAVVRVVLPREEKAGRGRSHLLEPERWVSAGERIEQERRPFPQAPSVPPHDTAREPAQGDRKSTRLNSSHVAISYAVFCLKKK